MVGNNYISAGKSYPLVGLVNGEIDNTIVSNGRDETMVYEVITAKGTVNLSDIYGVMTRKAEGWEFTNVAALTDGKMIAMIDGSYALVEAINFHKGREIIVGSKLFSLNSFLIWR